MSTEAYKALIIHALRIDLDDGTATPRAAVEHLKARFTAEYGWRLRQTTRQVALRDWVQGLALPVPFGNYDIYQWAHAHKCSGTNAPPATATDRVIRAYADGYWHLLAAAADELLDWLAEWQAAEAKASDPDPDDYESQYDEALDETQDPIHVGGITLAPSDVLKKCDPIAYRCGLLDYIGNLDIEPDTQGFEEEAEDLEQAADAMLEYFENLDTDN